MSGEPVEIEVDCTFPSSYSHAAEEEEDEDELVGGEDDEDDDGDEAASRLQSSPSEPQDSPSEQKQQSHTRLQPHQQQQQQQQSAPATAAPPPSPQPPSPTTQQQHVSEATTTTTTNEHAEQATPVSHPSNSIALSEPEQNSSGTCITHSASEQQHQQVESNTGEQLHRSPPSAPEIQPILTGEPLCNQAIESHSDNEADEDMEDEEEDEDGDADDDEDDDGDEEEDEDDEDDDDDDDDGDEDDDDDDDDDDDEELESDDSCEDIVDPGQHCQLVNHSMNISHNSHHFFATDGDLCDSVNGISNHHNHQLHHNVSTNCGEIMASSDGDLLDSDRIVEVTRKLVRDTERDPDRDLRKQVLLKTAIKKLPHFMEYTRYTDTLDRTFHCNGMTPQAYYEHDSQPKFYHSVQPNAIQMSTTSLRMLDLNDHDSENNAIEVEQQQINPTNQQPDEPSLSFNTRTSLDQTEYANQLQNNHQSQHHNSQYDRYHHHHHQDLNHQRNDFNHYETTNPMIGRHNSFDNLYQSNTNGSDIDESSKDDRIPIAFQIACDICDFTCAPDDNEKKLFDDLTNAYYSTKSGKHLSCVHTDPSGEIGLAELGMNEGVVDDGGLMTLGGDDQIEPRDQDNGSDTSSSSNSSSSTDDSVNSIASQSDDANSTSLLEASLNSSNDYYHSSHDSGVALFSPRSNKRSSSSIGLDDEMEIDHLTELSTRSQIVGPNNQYKKLRKREIID